MADIQAVTGATGLIGSHIVERLVQRGHRVRALVRPTSDVRFLKEQGVELAYCTFQDSQSLAKALDGVRAVFHCAAHVGDWGPWKLFQENIIDVTARVLDACRAANVERVVHTSSLTVYGNPRTGALIKEDEPRGQRMRWRDYYCRSKIMAEDLAWAYGPDAAIIRPGWSYGPRDRNTLPRIIKALQAGRIRMVGSGKNLMNLLYAADVADGAILASDKDIARGQAYNLCSEGELTQEQFLRAVTDAIHLPPVTRHFPYRVAYGLGLFSEIIAKVIRLKRAPYVTRYAVSLVGRSTRYSTEKARLQLGWQPKVAPQQGIAYTLEWLHQLEKEGLDKLPIGGLSQPTA